MIEQEPYGVVTHTNPSRSTDYLFRISIKCLVRNSVGHVLVVKESGRGTWDLPGGGMDHGEDIKSAISREMQEEVNLSGNFTYQIIAADEPAYLQTHDFWQLRLVFAVHPIIQNFSVGNDSDEVEFMDPSIFEHSDSEVERRIFKYSNVRTNASI